MKIKISHIVIPVFVIGVFYWYLYYLPACFRDDSLKSSRRYIIAKLVKNEITQKHAFKDLLELECFKERLNPLESGNNSLEPVMRIVYNPNYLVEETDWILIVDDINITREEAEKANTIKLNKNMDIEIIDNWDYRTIDQDHYLYYRLKN